MPSVSDHMMKEKKTKGYIEEKLKESSFVPTHIINRLTIYIG